MKNHCPGKPTFPAPFDLTGSPLAGTNLIEAERRNGKTYTIAGLYVRRRSGNPGQDILVVTIPSPPRKAEGQIAIPPRGPPGLPDRRL